jgi:hypothetical protein
MLVFLSFVRNSVVLAVYLLFLVSASLPYMSIRAGIVVTVTFHQVDAAPDAETGTQCSNQGLQYTDCTRKKCHNSFPPNFSVKLICLERKKAESPAC